MVAVGAMQPVERVGGVLIAVATGRAEVGHDAVGPIVADDLVNALAELVDLDLDRVLELVAPRSFPHRAGNGDEAPAQQRMGADFLLRGGYAVEPLQRAFVDFLQLVASPCFSGLSSSGIVQGHAQR
jgi:hypothetical protein